MVDEIFEDMHSQRLEALANYSAATMRAMRAGVHAIGAAYAETRTSSRCTGSSSSTGS